jgi:hypothetical protein
MSRLQFRATVLCLLSFLIGGSIAFGQATIPDPPTPVAQETPQPPPDLVIPEELPLNEHTSLDLKNISLQDVADGKTLLRIYPKNKITIFDGISFVNKKPYIILFPREAGQYNLVFILQKKDSFVFIEKEFCVK